jgi:hypothetical protein
MKPPCAAIVPSRDRPASLGRMLEAFGETAVCTKLIICLDDDDPQLPDYQKLRDQPRFTRHPVAWVTGSRRGLVDWTNLVARTACREHEALITLGDDHRPETPAWDREWLATARMMGGGWVYGDDGLQHENLPTAFLVSSQIVAALGWMLLKSCRHMFVDAAARDLAGACGRLAYLPDTSVRHLHYTSGLSPHDATYTAGYASWAADEAAYRAWLGHPEGTGPIRDDADTVRNACQPSTSP